MCDYVNAERTRKQYDKLRTELEIAISERDALREAYGKAREHFSDAWGLSVGYDGFEQPDSLKGLIDDIVMNMNKGRKIMENALEVK